MLVDCGFAYCPSVVVFFYVGEDRIESKFTGLTFEFDVGGVSAVSEQLAEYMVLGRGGGTYLGTVARRNSSSTPNVKSAFMIYLVWGCLGISFDLGFIKCSARGRRM